MTDDLARQFREAIWNVKVKLELCPSGADARRDMLQDDLRKLTQRALENLND